MRAGGTSKAHHYTRQKFDNEVATRLAALKLWAEIEATPKEQKLVQSSTNVQDDYTALANTDRLNWSLLRRGWQRLGIGLIATFQALLKKKPLRKR
jgi:hypothetical protein